MRESRYSDGQIAAALRQAELGTRVAEITPQNCGSRKPRSTISLPKSLPSRSETSSPSRDFRTFRGIQIGGRSH